MTDVEISHKAEYVPDEEEPEDPDDPSDDPADDKTDDKPGDKDKPDDSAKTPDKAQKSSSKAGSKIEQKKKNKTSKDKELSDIEALLEKARETADALHADAEKYSDDDLTAIEDVWKR